jgi:hypothetical protein
MSTTEDRTIRYEAARFAWVSELLAILDLRSGTPEWELQWKVARRLEDQYETAKREFLRPQAEE